MATVRMLTDDEVQEAVALVDGVFRDAEQTSMGKAYPFIFASSEAHQSYGAFDEEGTLVAFMGIVPWTIRIGEASIQAFSLGSVCTLPEARGQGYASAILQQVYRHIRQAGASLLLISGNKSLYAKSGCVPFGRMHRYRLDEESAAGLLRSGLGETTHIRAMSATDLFALQRVASSRNVRYELSTRDLGALIKAEGFASNKKQTHRLLVAETYGTVTAFVVVGVSIEQGVPGLVIEQAGDPSAVARLAAEAVERFGLSYLDFPVPWHEQALIKQLSRFDVPFTLSNHSGTIKIMDGDALLAQLRPWLENRRPGSMAGLRLTQTDESSWLLHRLGDKPPVAISDQDLVRLVFDCASISEQSLPTELGSLADLFPVPLPHTVGLCYI
ncbi:GNAT family N-acetyltransferase [Paenibacillus sp. GCM10027626]|uniref:GNAT family N-acetyltransferase n=1 Tax=Paenibacillus sp. GCM10027626 TaxID=3273411 RepID=UPI00364531FB